MVKDDPQRRMEVYVCSSSFSEHIEIVHPTLSPLDFILAACDVEGNFLVVKAYQYTTLLSCMLLDAWAIPVCLFFSWLYMRPKYHWTQLLVRSYIPPPVPIRSHLANSFRLAGHLHLRRRARHARRLGRAHGQGLACAQPRQGRRLYARRRVAVWLQCVLSSLPPRYPGLTPMHSECDGGILRPQVSAVRGRWAAGHVGRAHQRHPGCRARTPGHDHRKLEWRDQSVSLHFMTQSFHLNLLS